MTVKELIAKLEEFDDDLEVFTVDDFFGDPRREVFTVTLGTTKIYPVIASVITEKSKSVVIIN